MDEADAFFRNTTSAGLIADYVSYTSLIDGYFKAGKESAALDIVQEMMEKNIGFDVVAYNVLINGLLGLGKYEVQILYAEMRQRGLIPNSATFNTMITAYCRQGKVESALNLLSEMDKFGLSYNYVTYNTLVKGLCEASQIDEAMKFLSKMQDMGLRPTTTAHNYKCKIWV
ncbi:hypothetical protein AgCh_004236 [Apium graveolens]